MEFTDNLFHQTELNPTANQNLNKNEVFESEPELSGSQSDVSDIDDDLLETGHLSPPPDETTQYINSGADDKSNECSNIAPVVEEKTNDCFLLPATCDLTASEFPTNSRSQFHIEESTNCAPKLDLQNTETSDSRQLIDPQLGAVVRKSIAVIADDHTTCTYLLLQSHPNLDHLNSDLTNGSGASQLLSITAPSASGLPLQPFLSELSLSSLASIPRVILLPVPLPPVVPPAFTSSAPSLSDARPFASTIGTAGAEPQPHAHPHLHPDLVHETDTWRTPSRPLHRCASTLSTASVHSSRPPSERDSDEDEDEEKRARRPNRRIQQCPHCTFSTDRGFVLKRHIAAKHSDDRPFVCDREGCESTFATREALAAHANSHTGARPHLCSHCDSTFSTSSSLARHIKYKHSESSGGGRGTERHRCEHCAYEAVELSKLRRHELIHLDSKPFACEYPACNYTCRTRSNLQKHSRTHEKGKASAPTPTAASHSSASSNVTSDAVSLASLLPAAAAHTPAVAPVAVSAPLPRVFRCERCTCVFRRAKSLATHQLRLHSNLSRALTCASCAAFSSLRVRRASGNGNSHESTAHQLQFATRDAYRAHTQSDAHQRARAFLKQRRLADRRRAARAASRTARGGPICGALSATGDASIATDSPSDACDAEQQRIVLEPLAFASKVSSSTMARLRHKLVANSESTSI